MAILRFNPAQTGADATTAMAMNLPSLDGKSGYEFRAIEVYWKNVESAAAADYEVYVAVQKVSGALGERIGIDDWIVGVSWAQQNTGGVAVAVNTEPYKSQVLISPITTVSPDLQLVIVSGATAQTNQFGVIVHYDLVKLSELEYLRLLAAGG